jgi:hypothetical protein
MMAMNSNFAVVRYSVEIRRCSTDCMRFSFKG